MARRCPNKHPATVKSMRSLKFLQYLHEPVQKKLQLHRSVVYYLGIGIVAYVAITISIGEGFAMASLAPSRAVSPGMPVIAPETGIVLVAISIGSIGTTATVTSVVCTDSGHRSLSPTIWLNDKRPWPSACFAPLIQIS